MYERGYDDADIFGLRRRTKFWIEQLTAYNESDTVTVHPDKSPSRSQGRLHIFVILIVRAASSPRARTAI
jgi:hypothetical protein